MSKRLMVIGLDGAEWNLIKSWVELGQLPTFKRLIDNGTWGLLKSTIPASSAPAWTSAFTGVNPGKHNVFEFFSSKGYSLKLTNATDRKAQAVWEILSEKGLKVFVINVPMTYPPNRVNGIMISGIVGSTQRMAGYTYPKDIESKLAQIGYIIEARIPETGGIHQVLDMTEKLKQLVIDFSKENTWDLFIVVFTAPDRVQHHFWKHEHADVSAWKKENTLDDAIFRTYETLDSVIEELLESIGKNTNFIFLSDHGFRPARRAVFLNYWFKNVGLLKHVEQSKLELFEADLKELLKRVGHYLPDNMKALVRSRRRRKSSSLITKVDAQSENIDWSKTKAWAGMPGPGKVRINLRGREPLGIVEPGKEYDNLRNDIIEKLSELTDPDNEEKVVEKVYKREEIYHGPFTKNSSDLFVEPKDGYVFPPMFGERLFDESKWIGTHRIHGVFFAYGPDIRKSNGIRNAEITDIAPTILHMLGLPIPRVMDGRVLKEIFEEESELSKKKILYEDSKKKRVRSKEVYTKKEAREIRKRLEHLGYI